MKKFVLIFLLFFFTSLSAEDMTLRESYERALSYEASIKSNMYQTSAKKEEIDQARSRLYPKVDVSAAGNWGDYKIASTGGKRYESYSTLKLSGQLPLYHPENFNMLDQAKLKYRLSTLNLKQLKQDLALKVTDSFLSIIKARNSLSVAKAYRALNKAKYLQIEKKFNKRLSNKMDLLQSRVTYEESIIKVSIERRNLRIEKYKFKNLTGIDIEALELPSVDFEHLDVSSLIMPFSKKELMGANLEIKEAEIQLAISRKEVKNASYSRYPKADLSANIAKYDNPSRYRDYDHEETAMVIVKLPLYDGGYASASIVQNEELSRASAEDLNQIIREKEFNYDQYTTDLKTARENIALYKETIASAKLYLYATNKGYEHGLKSLIDVEVAKARLYESKIKLIDSVYNFMKAYASLLNIYGLLDPDKLDLLDHTLLPNF